MDTAVLVALGIDAELVVVAGEDGVEQVMPLEKPRPHTRMTAAMMRLRDLVRSTLFSTMLRTPMAEIMP